jgi:hypothetical protein
VSALACYLEDEGIATTGISLIRVHSERMRPPRALWVPFELGRPLGAPGDPSFQRRVLYSCFDLLTRRSGPVLEDFPDEAPSAARDDGSSLSCPVPAARPTLDPRAPVARVQREIRALAPWVEVAWHRRGSRTGVRGLDVEEALSVVASFLGGEAAEPEPAATAEGLRLAAEDLKGFYADGASAQPGAASTAEIRDWFWDETALGSLLVAVSDACRLAADEDVRRVGGWSLIPQAYERRPGAWQPPIPDAPDRDRKP